MKDKLVMSFYFDVPWKPHVQSETGTCNKRKPRSQRATRADAGVQLHQGGRVRPPDRDPKAPETAERLRPGVGKCKAQRLLTRLAYPDCDHPCFL